MIQGMNNTKAMTGKFRYIVRMGRKTMVMEVQSEKTGSARLSRMIFLPSLPPFSFPSPLHHPRVLLIKQSNIGVIVEHHSSPIRSVESMRFARTQLVNTLHLLFA